MKLSASEGQSEWDWINERMRVSDNESEWRRECEWKWVNKWVSERVIKYPSERVTSHFSFSQTSPKGTTNENTPTAFQFSFYFSSYKKMFSYSWAIKDSRPSRDAAWQTGIAPWRHNLHHCVTLTSLRRKRNAHRYTHTHTVPMRMSVQSCRGNIYMISHLYIYTKDKIR